MQLYVLMVYDLNLVYTLYAVICINGV